MTAARHVPSRPVSCREKDKNKIPTSKYEIAFGYLWKEWERSLKFKTQTKKEIQMNASKGNVDTISLAGQRLIGACWCHPSQALRHPSYCPFLSNQPCKGRLVTCVHLSVNILFLELMFNCVHQKKKNQEGSKTDPRIFLELGAGVGAEW